MKEEENSLQDPQLLRTEIVASRAVGKGDPRASIWHSPRIRHPAAPMPPVPGNLQGDQAVQLAKPAR